jgi:hypothetical protein
MDGDSDAAAAAGKMTWKAHNVVGLYVQRSPPAAAFQPVSIAAAVPVPAAPSSSRLLINLQITEQILLIRAEPLAGHHRARLI